MKFFGLFLVACLAASATAVNYQCGWNGLFNGLAPEQRCHDKISGATDLLLHTFANRGDTFLTTDSDELVFTWWTYQDTSIPLLEATIQWWDVAPDGSGSVGWKDAYFKPSTGYSSGAFTYGSQSNGWTNVYHRQASSHINSCGCDEEGEGTNLTIDCYEYQVAFKDVVSKSSGATIDGWGDMHSLTGRTGNTRLRIWVRRRSGQTAKMDVCYDTNDLVGTATGFWSLYGCYLRVYAPVSRENVDPNKMVMPEEAGASVRDWELPDPRNWNNNGGTGDSTWK